MARLLFEKTGQAVWISHLDLMRLFQRAFKRAGLPLKHTQGFSPRPSVSIALPLSVGVESVCELLDFELEGDLPPMDAIRDRLNAALVEGVKVLSVSHGGKKIKELAFLSCGITMNYDSKLDAKAAPAIKKLFCQDLLYVDKKTKNGHVEQDILPMIDNLDVQTLNDHQLYLSAVICCQNPSLNPIQIMAAVERYLPQYKPDHAVCRRLELFDREKQIFR